MVDSVTTTINGYTVIAQYNPEYQRVSYVINNPNGSLLLSAGNAQAAMSGVRSLANEAIDAGNSALASSLSALNMNLVMQSPSIDAQAMAQYKPTPPEPTPTDNSAALTPTATNDKPLPPISDDDSGNTQSNPAGSSGAPPSSPANPSGSVTNPTPASVSAAAAAAPTPPNGDLPGKRLYNPLSQLSSYTYQLSLYMITPDAYSAFLASGKQSINVIPQSLANSPSINTAAQTNTFINSNTGQPIIGGAYLIAQSGGSGNPANRAPGIDFDYGIDNLSFDHVVSTNGSGAAAVNSDIKFTITEPYGFSLIDKIKTAQTVINNYSSAINIPDNPTKSLFILGIRFFGYLPDGTLATGKEIFNGIPLDPNAGGVGALFETYYDININTFGFKLGAGTTTYDIEATYLASSTGFGTKYGYLNGSPNFTCKGSTVGEVLSDLASQLNAKQQQLTNTSNGQKPSQQYPIAYTFEYQGNAATTVANASMINPADNNKAKAAMSGATNSAQSNPKAEVTGVYNPNIKTITFASQPILQCIDQTITSSTYVTDALSSNTTNSTNGDNTVIPNPNPTYPVWYNCSVRVENPRWDNIIHDWIFDIVYVIREYQTPLVNSPAISTTQPYYGPYKRYQYWYTGKNSEITEYSHTINNGYFLAALNQPGPDPLKGAPNTATTAPAQSTPQSSTNTQGNGAEAVASYKDSLYNPVAYSDVHVSVLGDPDFLIQDTANQDNHFNTHYSPNGYSIAPNGGQVFVEINFNEAIDYDTTSNGTGLMNLNDKVYFQTYPNSVNILKDANGNPLVQGVSYQVNTVKNTFSGGKFTQSFEMTVNPFNGVPVDSNAASSASQSSNPGPSPTNASKQAPTTGLKPAPQTDAQNGTVSQPQPAQQKPAEATT